LVIFIASRGQARYFYLKPPAPRVTLATVELDAQEALALLQLVRTRQADLDRIVQNLEEGEGMDLQRHNALKSVRPQIELLDVLAIKLAGAVKELEPRR